VPETCNDGTLDERDRRIGLNEAVFREVNERIKDLADAFGLNEDVLDLVCECGNAGCVEQIRMSPADYQAMREDPTLFAVHPGHEIREVEAVVDKREGYDIVRKHEGEPARIAERTDPRS
jgi:hypothetical protein